MPDAGSSDFYNVTISAVTAASACITTVSLAEQAAQNGDIATATAAIFVAQETMAAAAAALSKDVNAVRNHTNSVGLLCHLRTSSHPKAVAGPKYINPDRIILACIPIKRLGCA